MQHGEYIGRSVIEFHRYTMFIVKEQNVLSIIVIPRDQLLIPVIFNMLFLILKQKYPLELKHEQD